MSSPQLVQLLHLCDPALPIGGFSHSAGLETYVQAGMVYNRATAKEFVWQQLSQSIYYTDAAFVSLAYDCSKNNDLQTLLQFDEECTALKLPKEMRLASNKLGIRLLKLFKQQVYSDIFLQYAQSITMQHAYGHYCIVFGLIAEACKIEKMDALTGFYYNAATGFVTNAVKLIPLGQQDGHEILMELFPLINELSSKSLHPDKELLGLCSAGFDIKSMQHEHLYSRLYMS
ncbi:MAG: urease accessory protein UreF [Chitinophagaceae bacterium]|nr:urease accessory protein UreF [Chitinophagaceae bacterium]